MRVAALYDVHGMPWALDAVLAEVDADAIVVGGDFIYGPYPEVTLERVRRLDASVVRGIGVLPVFAGLIGLLLLLGSVAAVWMREGR